MNQGNTSPEQVQQAIQQQAGKLLSQAAGYVGLRTIEIGLRHGLLDAVARHPQGITASALAKETSLAPQYVQVWCRSAYAAEVLELGPQDVYTLAPYMDKLLLDQDFPGYVGGLPRVMVQPEVFDRFAEHFPSGQRLWWNQCSPTWIQAVAVTGQPFYTRLIPAGLSRVPGLPEKLGQGARVLELACGAGIGLVRLAKAYPNCSLVGVDGDAYSLELVKSRLASEGLRDGIALVQSSLEEFHQREAYDVALINISMHECRDIAQVAANVYHALRPGGIFVISDFPFPGSTAECRTVPARVMCGIQFFEALIGDQLLPTQTYLDLLAKHGFRNIGAFDLTPLHAVSHGQK